MDKKTSSRIVYVSVVIFAIFGFARSFCFLLNPDNPGIFYSTTENIYLPMFFILVVYVLFIRIYLNRRTGEEKTEKVMLKIGEEKDYGRLILLISIGDNSYAVLSQGERTCVPCIKSEISEIESELEGIKPIIIAQDSRVLSSILRVVEEIKEGEIFVNSNHVEYILRSC